MLFSPDEFLAEAMPIAKKIAIATGSTDYNILQNNGAIAHQVRIKMIQRNRIYSLLGRAARPFPCYTKTFRVRQGGFGNRMATAAVGYGRPKSYL
jgi:hypothetical protein